MNKRELVIAMWAAGIIRFAGEEEEGFRWQLHRPGRFPEASLSPMKIEFRSADTDKERHAIVGLLKLKAGKVIGDYVRQEKLTPPQLVCGVPNVGMTVAAGLVQYWPSVSQPPRFFAGLRKLNDEISLNPLANWPNNAEVMLVDDVLSHADSKLQAINILKGRASVKAIAVLVDYQLGGQAKLESAGVKVLAVMHATELLNTLVDDNLIPWSTHSRCLRWFEEIRQLTAAVRA